LFLQQNLIAGDDFAIDHQKILPAPPSAFPSLSGNVKIASDVFLQGNLYTHCDLAHPDLWLNLDQCIHERIKNSVRKSYWYSHGPVLPQSTGDASGTISASTDVTITTQLAQVDDAQTQLQHQSQEFIGKAPEVRSFYWPLVLSRKGVSGQGAAAVSASNPSFQIVTSGTVSLKSDTTAPTISR